MADTQDIIRANAIETLSKGSSINLAGGGALAGFAAYLVYKTNDGDNVWVVSDSVIITLIIGAVVLGAIGMFARMFDASLRAKLTHTLITTKGTSDVPEADKMPLVSTANSELIDKFMNGSFGSFLLARQPVEVRKSPE